MHDTGIEYQNFSHYAAVNRSYLDAFRLPATPMCTSNTLFNGIKKAVGDIDKDIQFNLILSIYLFLQQFKTFHSGFKTTL